MIKFQSTAYLLRKNVLNIAKRSLFSDSFTFLEKFKKCRLNLVAKSEVEFIHEIQNATIPTLLNSTKLWTFAATSKPDHIALLHQSLKRLEMNRSTNETDQMIFEFQNLGQLIMRLFDHLELPENALQFYYEFNNDFIDSASASFLLMNLLFKQKRYDDVLNVYRIRTVDRQRESTSLHQTLVYAACYKLNRPELLQYSLDVRNTSKSWQDRQKGRYFEAMLAFNQNQFQLALALTEEEDFIAFNIKLLTLAKLNNWTGVCDVLYKIKMNRSNGMRYRVITDVLQRIKQDLDLVRSDLTPQEYDRCYRFIQEFAYLGKFLLRAGTMDEFLCVPINGNRTKEDLSTKKRKLNLRF